MAFLTSALKGLQGLGLQLLQFWPLWLFVVLVVSVNFYLKIRKAVRRDRA
jgi:hypothetical protein